MGVRSIAKVTAVALVQALAHNLMAGASPAGQPCLNIGKNSRSRSIRRASQRLARFPIGWHVSGVCEVVGAFAWLADCDRCGKSVVESVDGSTLRRQALS